MFPASSEEGEMTGYLCEEPYLIGHFVLQLKYTIQLLNQSKLYIP